LKPSEIGHAEPVFCIFVPDKGGDKANNLFAM